MGPVETVWQELPVALGARPNAGGRAIRHFTGHCLVVCQYKGPQQEQQGTHRCKGSTRGLSHCP